MTFSSADMFMHTCRFWRCGYAEPGQGVRRQAGHGLAVEADSPSLGV